jgi:hypothetical protein
MLRPTISRTFHLGVWPLRPMIRFLLVSDIFGLHISLPDEMRGLKFTRTVRCHSAAQVPQNSWPQLTVSFETSRSPSCRLLRLTRLRWGVLTRLNTASSSSSSSSSYIETDGQSASSSWTRPDFYYCRTFSFFMLRGAQDGSVVYWYNALSLSGPSPAELMTTSYCLIWDPLQPEEPDPRIYISQEKDGPVILSGTGFPFCLLLRLAGIRMRYFNPPPHGNPLIWSWSWS